jgi:hypothetical protein
MKVKILNLRPTQFAVGMLEVDEKIKEISQYSKKKLKKFVKTNIVPVVRGLDQELYVVDKHHFLTICFQLGIKRVNVDIIKDFNSDSDLTYEEFWTWMFSTRNSYPFCQFGEGPREPFYLPHDVRGLADDPYRSIAWFVRKAGAFENSDKNFAEFQWANFFRSKNLLHKHGKKGLPEALLEAVRLSQSEEARNLPGFDILNKKEKIEVQESVKEKGHEIIEHLKDKDLPVLQIHQ